MDRRRRLDPPPTPPPNPNPPSSPFLHDISNYKTPLPHSRNPNPNPSPLFFTASKNTPSSFSSFRHKPFSPSLPQSKAARRLKSLQLEQSKSARKAETRKAKTLKSFSRSVAGWLDFLFENPEGCGCEIGMGSDCGRGWKRQRNCEEEEEEKGAVVMSAEKVSTLRDSLKDVCSLDDLSERMDGYMSKKGRNEVLSIMSRLCKNIDEGRLKMKAHCPIVTDLALKEKSIKVLMCYNPTWLRIGLHIIFGGDSLVNEEGKPDQEGAFLKLIIENQFFTQIGISRAYAYNKLVEGLYKPGFYEALGSIILKRFLLLVISLDKAKCESTLPPKYGIDGIDGGSPMLFSCNSYIKSSRQVVQEFLSEAMHGEGDLLSHLAILGCKLNYQQFPLAEYEFRIRNLFQDLQDGILLCRAIQLLQSDASILSKVLLPSDSYKKRLQNCSIALQYLKQAGVPLSDGDGVHIIPEDIVNGDKELTLSVLWNMFVYLQVPLLIDRLSLAKEIAKLKGSDVVLPNFLGNTELDLLLSWVQTVCQRQRIEVGNFSSIIKGKAFCCLIDYYFQNEVCKYSSRVQCGEELISEFDTVTTAEAHNLSFIQSVIATLGNFPMLFQLCDMLDQDISYDERSFAILLVFLASRLICRNNVVNVQDELKYKISQQKYRRTDLKSSIVPQTPLCRKTPFSDSKFRLKKLLEFMSPQRKSGMDEGVHLCSPLTVDKLHDCFPTERAANVLQAHFRGFTARKKLLKHKVEASLREQAACVIQSQFRRFTERKKFLKTQKAACLQETAANIIQAHFRGFIVHEKLLKLKMEASLQGQAACVIQSHLSERKELVKILNSPDLQERAACIIQSHFRRYTERKKFLKVQNAARLQERAASYIQSHFRGFVVRRNYMKIKMAACFVQTAVRAWLAVISNCKLKTVTLIWSVDGPSYGACDGFLRFMFERHRFLRLKKSVIVIQQATRGWLTQKNQRKYDAVTSIQSFIRGQIARSRYVELLATLEKQQCTSAELEDCERVCKAAIKIRSGGNDIMNHDEHPQKISAAIRIQSYWRCWYLRKNFLRQVAAVREIQAGIRCIINQKTFNLYRFAAIEIQRFVRGNHARNRLIGSSSLPHGRLQLGPYIMTNRYQSPELKIIMDSVLKLQRWWKHVLLLKFRTLSATTIQSFIRGWNDRRTIKKKRLSIFTIQRWWKNILSRKQSVILIQAHVRGWIARREAERHKHNIVVIQSYWKGYVVRKHSRKQIADLRIRIQKSSVNVDDNRRLINKLVAALSELLGYKSVSNIRHTCATLNTATELSQRCCETLVSVGAIDILLKQFYSLNRGIPDQEVLKHVISTLKNISCYTQLLQVLIDTPHAVEIIFQELLRNKSDVFFVTYELMKKICATQHGRTTVRRLHWHVRRLNNFVHDLERKSDLQKRNSRLCAGKDNTLLRLRAATDLLTLISDEH